MQTRGRFNTIAAAISILAVAMVSAAPATSSKPQSGKTRTVVAGAWQATPTALPTSGSFKEGRASFHITGVQTWHGTLTGVSRFDLEGTWDTATGDYAFHSAAPTLFEGSYLGDHSTGTLTWNETVTGNMFTGATFATNDILGGDGDATFKCSSGRVSWDGHTDPVTSFGGYNGTWVHTCP